MNQHQQCTAPDSGCPYGYKDDDARPSCAAPSDERAGICPDVKKQAFWSTQAELAMRLQLDIARTLHWCRMRAEPTPAQDLLALAQAMDRCAVIYTEAEGAP